MGKQPNTNPSDCRETSWPHRLACALAVAAFGRIGLGATIAAYKAEMTIGDWPTTHGHWLYPIGKWLGSNRDLFLVQGHRMLVLVLLGLAIAATVVVWRGACSKSARVLAIATVLVMLLQTGLGGFRVLGTLGDDILIRKLHAAVVPLFGAMCVALAVVTSNGWLRRAKSEISNARLLERLAAAVALGIFLLIFLGGQLRHQPLDVEPMWFVLWVWLKLIAAGLVTLLLGWLAVFTLRHARKEAVKETMIVRCVRALGALFLVQLGLGAAVWVTNYALPVWFTDYVWAVQYTVVAEGTWQVVTVTSHAIVGPLTAAAAIVLTLWAKRPST